jgi:hypothetical protein
VPCAEEQPGLRGDEAADSVRELARSGHLAERAKDASGADRIWLNRGAYVIVSHVVFHRLTRRNEYKRGHPTCASAVHRMRPECSDCFQDDVKAAMDDLFRHATVPIDNLEGWIGSRLVASTVDAYRRRRGERGALQRPRVPVWLGRLLGDDPWLTTLGREMVGWVGVAKTAGTGVWPLDSWARLREAVTGDVHGSSRVVAADVETVLRAMRHRPAWYAKYIERPLGRKETQTLPAGVAGGPEPQPLALTEPDARHDAHLTALAATAVAAIEARLGRGEKPRDAVVTVLTAVFGHDSGSAEMDQAPGTAPAGEDRVSALLADPAAIDRIVDIVLGILAEPG